MEEESLPVEEVAEKNLYDDNNAQDAEIETRPMQFEKTLPNEVNQRLSKRGREMDDEERWITVGRNSKRVVQKVDLYISSYEKLPKQFALAKLLKANNIADVIRVKYINPYKVLIQFENADSMEELINCKPLQDLGWRCYKPMEVNISYGVIKNVELELCEKDILDMISSNFELISVKRLKRRSKEINEENNGKGWEDSESVRLGFKGSSLPAFVYIYGMKVNVEPYVFPVTQCSRCWRYGHSLRSCPSTKIICPKCGKNHANCETSVFKCINCTGNHFSLDRTCPMFKKEKRLRDLMAEFNCSYRKAMQLYVPPEPPISAAEQQAPASSATIHNLPGVMPAQSQNANRISYANITKTLSQSSTPVSQLNAMNSTTSSQGKTKKSKKKKQNLKESGNWNIYSESEEVMNEFVNESESDIRSNKETEEKRENLRATLNFRQLLHKLYGVFFISQDNIKSKILQGVTLFIEWLLTIAGQYISDLPFQTLFST